MGTRVRVRIMDNRGRQANEEWELQEGKDFFPKANPLSSGLQIRLNRGRMVIHSPETGYTTAGPVKPGETLRLKHLVFRLITVVDPQALGASQQARGSADSATESLPSTGTLGISIPSITIPKEGGKRAQLKLAGDRSDEDLAHDATIHLVQPVEDKKKDSTKKLLISDKVQRMKGDPLLKIKSDKRNKKALGRGLLGAPSRHIETSAAVIGLCWPIIFSASAEEGFVFLHASSFMLATLVGILGSAAIAWSTSHYARFMGIYGRFHEHFRVMAGASLVGLGIHIVLRFPGFHPAAFWALLAAGVALVLRKRFRNRRAPRGAK